MPRSLASPRTRSAPRPRRDDAATDEAIVVRLLSPGDARLLETADNALLDGVDARAVSTLLCDPRRHVAIALAGSRVVGVAFASDQPRARRAPELVVGDVTVAPSHRRRGIGRRLLALLLAHGRVLGCSEASAEAERGNGAMRRLCARMGGVEAAEPTVRVSFPLG